MNSKLSFFYSKIFTSDLVTFTEEILNGKLNFLCGDLLNAAPLKFRQSSSTFLKEMLDRIIADCIIFALIRSRASVCVMNSNTILTRRACF